MALNSGSKLTEINLLFSQAEETLEELHTENLAEDDKEALKEEFITLLENMVYVCKLL